jgi:hypothetical protein
MGTRQDIRNKVRQLTGRKSQVQLLDAEIDFQIDNYYQTEFPLQFRSNDLRQEFSMTLSPNVDVYTVNAQSFQSIEPVCYVEGYPTLFIEDRSTLHKLFPDIRQDVNLGFGSASIGAGPYNFSLNVSVSTPILKGTVLVYAPTGFSTQTSVVDDSNGNLVDLNPDGTFGTNRGSINYQTGAITVTFAVVIPPGNNINVQSRQYASNRPTTVWYWVTEQETGQLTFRPVPDKPYNIRIVTYNIPVLGTSPTATPTLIMWWEALAYGASMKIFENLKDLKSSTEMEVLLERKLILLGRQQWFQLRTQRTRTIYNTPMNGISPGDGYFGFFGNSW